MSAMKDNIPPTTNISMSKPYRLEGRESSLVICADMFIGRWYNGINNLMFLYDETIKTYSLMW